MHGGLGGRLRGGGCCGLRCGRDGLRGEAVLLGKLRSGDFCKHKLDAIAKATLYRGVVLGGRILKMLAFAGLGDDGFEEVRVFGAEVLRVSPPEFAKADIEFLGLADLTAMTLAEASEELGGLAVPEVEAIMPFELFEFAEILVAELFKLGPDGGVPASGQLDIRCGCR